MANHATTNEPQRPQKIEIGVSFTITKVHYLICLTYILIELFHFGFIIEPFFILLFFMNTVFTNLDIFCWSIFFSLHIWEFW